MGKKASWLPSKNEREEKLLSKVPNTHTNKGILLKNHTRRREKKREKEGK